MSYLDKAVFTLGKTSLLTRLTPDQKVMPIDFERDQIKAADFSLHSKDNTDIDLFATQGSAGSFDFNYFKKIIELFDTLHDFGKFGICYDSIMFSRTDGRNYYDNIAFYFLAKFGFKLEDIRIPMYFSNFSTSTGTVPSLLSVKELENYFCLHSISNKLGEVDTTGQKNFFFIHDCKDSPRAKEIGNNIAGLFDHKGWVDPVTRRINLIIDTSKTMGDCFEGTGKYAYVLTQESINDPSGKLSIFDKNKIRRVYGEDGYYYEKPGQQRVYRATNNNPRTDYRRDITVFGEIEGLYDMQFMGLTIDTDEEKMGCEISLNYNDKKYPMNCVLNASKKHINCITQVKKQVNAITSEVPKQDFVPDDKLNRVAFYTTFINSKDEQNKLKEEEKNKNFVRLFSQKRYGDALQKGIMGLVNNNIIPEFICNRIDDSEHIITKLVLLTIDRMLFTYCVLNGEPAILDGCEYMIIYIPKYEDKIGATGRTTKKSKAASKASAAAAVAAAAASEAAAAAAAASEAAAAAAAASEAAAVAKESSTTGKKKSKGRSGNSNNNGSVIGLVGGGRRDEYIRLVTEEINTEPIIFFETIPILLNYLYPGQREGPFTRITSVLELLNDRDTLYTNRIYENCVLTSHENNSISNDLVLAYIENRRKLLIYIDLEGIKMEAYTDDVTNKIHLNVSQPGHEDASSDKLEIEPDIITGLVETRYSEKEAREARGGMSIGGGQPSRIEQYRSFLSNPLKYNKDEIITIYLELLEHYELLLCLDEEQIGIDFTEYSKSQYIADKKALYLFFKKLSTGKNSIPYYNIEYYLYSSPSKYGKGLYDSLQNIKLFVLGEDYDYSEPTFNNHDQDKSKAAREFLYKATENSFNKIIDDCYKKEISYKDTKKSELVKLFNRYSFSTMLSEFRSQNQTTKRKTVGVAQQVSQRDSRGRSRSNSQKKSRSASQKSSGRISQGRSRSNSLKRNIVNRQLIPVGPVGAAGGSRKYRKRSRHHTRKSIR